MKKPFKLPTNLRNNKPLLEKAVKDLTQGIFLDSVIVKDTTKIDYVARRQKMEETLALLKEAIKTDYPDPSELFKEIIKK